MSKMTKKRMLDVYERRFKDVAGTILLDFTGLDAEKTHEFRRNMGGQDFEVMVLKNSLFVRALGLEGYDLQGPTAAVWGDDTAAVAKEVVRWAKKIEAIQIKGGTLGKAPIDQDKVKALAALPSRQVLLAQVVGGFAAPMSGFANVLAGTIRKLVYAVRAIKESKEGDSND